MVQSLYGVTRISDCRYLLDSEWSPSRRYEEAHIYSIIRLVAQKPCLRVGWCRVKAKQLIGLAMVCTKPMFICTAFVRASATGSDNVEIPSRFTRLILRESSGVGLWFRKNGASWAGSAADGLRAAARDWHSNSSKLMSGSCTERDDWHRRNPSSLNGSKSGRVAASVRARSEWDQIELSYRQRLTNVLPLRRSLFLDDKQAHSGSWAPLVWGNRASVLFSQSVTKRRSEARRR